MDQNYKNDFILAGKIAAQVLSYGKSLIVKGASYNDVILKIRQKIAELGAIPAFPPQIALDFIAAHYLPEPNQDIIFHDELIKLDIGVCVRGAIGDCATSVDLSGKRQHIVEAAEAALEAAVKKVKVGVSVSEIGAVIEQTIVARGLRPIRNLSGHGLGKFKIHTTPYFPNYDDKSKFILKPGMTFAIEPFATDGKGSIFDAGNATLFSLQKANKKYSGHIQQVYEVAKKFDMLPFCIHDLISDTLPYEIVKRCINALLKDQAIIDYAPLVEEEEGFVAQAEHSFLIDENGVVFVTTRS